MLLKINIRKHKFPKTKLENGYAVRLVDTRNLTEEDRKQWVYLQKYRTDIKNHSILLIPPLGAVTFAEFKGKPVGCFCVKKWSEDLAENRHAIILPEHRQKGLFKAMAGEQWQYCIDEGVKWLNLSPISPYLQNFWFKLGAVKNVNRSVEQRHSLAGPVELWDTQRQFQIAFLKEHGLKPHHTLLDFGCGPLRGGIPIIKYLNNGNYYGVDRNREALAEAEKELEENKLEHKLPTLTNNKNLETLKLNKAFDFIWAFSVAIHMKDNVFETFIAFISNHLKRNGVLYMNVNIGERRTGGRFLTFRTYVRPLNFYRDILSKHNLKIIDSETTQNQTMLCVASKEILNMKSNYVWGYSRKTEPRGKILFDVLKPFLIKGDTILDVDCGYSPLAKHLLENGYSLTGFDVSEIPILHLQRTHPDGKWVTMDDAEAQFRNQSVILLLGVTTPLKPVYSKTYLETTERLLNSNSPRIVLVESADQADQKLHTQICKILTPQHSLKKRGQYDAKMIKATKRHYSIWMRK